MTASYVRSNTRSNQVLDFNVDKPIYGPQLSGPFLPRNADDRFLSTGILPGKPLRKAKDATVPKGPEKKLQAKNENQPLATLATLLQKLARQGEYLRLGLSSL